MDWILLTSIVALLLLAIVISNSRSGRARNLRQFRRRVPLPMTDAAAAAIPRRLIRETLGAALGCAPGLLVAVALESHSSALLNSVIGSTIIPLMIAGAALGIAIASTTRLEIPNPEMPRIARTTVPRITDYISAAWIVVSATLCVAGLTSAVLMRMRGQADALLAGTTVAVIAAGILTLVLCSVLSRRLLNTPQPASNSIELAWDDAVRAHAFRSLWTAPLALGTTAAYLALNLSLSGVQPPPALAFTAIVTAVQILLQLSRSGKRFRLRLWPDLAEGL